jgi:predicted ATPase/DNA-binding XRE family transcriptional regulator
MIDCAGFMVAQVPFELKGKSDIKRIVAVLGKGVLMDFVPPFRRWLKQQRNALGLTQAMLAARTYYATVTLRKIEEGRLKPSREMAMKLAEALEVPADAREDFVAFARGLDARRVLHLLPVAGAPLISRQHEIQDVAGLLMQDDVRLVTLLGPPGVGKTRLAIEIGHHLASDFADGVCFVALAEVRNSGDVAPAIAAHLGVLVASHTDAVPALIQVLQPLELLLILDNFEHMLGAAHVINDLLFAAPNLTVLATSRAPLNVMAEHRYEVLPLAVPIHGQDMAALLACPSVQLFSQGAQRVKPAFKLTPENIDAVAEVCAHLEGLPLAIELAAGRTTMFSPHTLASRLRAHSDEVLALRSAGARDAPSHHRTLRTTIDWSYQLLDADTQRAFRFMGVFAGGFTLAAAEAVCGGLPVDDNDPLRIAGTDDAFLRCFESLLAHNLVRQASSADEDEMRFDLLETLHEFVLDELDACGEKALASDRHASYYARLADAMFFGRPSIEDALWMRRMRAERANLQNALAWRMSHNDNIEQELLLSAVVNHAAWVSGLMWGVNAPSAGIESWLNRIELMALSNKMASPEARAKALHGLVERAIYENDEPRITRLQHIFTQFYIDSGIPRLIVLGHYSRAYLVQRRGEAQAAIAQFQFARETAHRHGLRDSEANALGAKGFLLLAQSDDLEAEACLKEAVSIQREIGMEWCIGQPLPQCLRLLAFLAQARGDYAASLFLLTEARSLFDKYGDNAGVMASLILMGRAHLKTGHHEEALLNLKQAAPLCLQWSRDWLAAVLALMAAVKLEMGEIESAARLAGAASRHDPVMRQLPYPRIQLREDYDRILAGVRLNLNGNTQAVWEEGAMLLDEEALAFIVRA